MSTGAAGWNVERVGDYNADGTSDLLLQNGVGDVVNWIVRNGQYASGNVVMTGLSAGWKIA
jgi:hypothetical protein